LVEDIADAHIHICKDDWRFGADLVFTWNDLESRFKNHELSRAVVLPMISNVDDSTTANEIFFKESETFPFRDKIWAYYWPHPHEIAPKMFEENRVDGIKFHPSISQTRIDNASQVIKMASVRNLPLLVHCGRNQISRIDYLITASRIEPDVIYIGAHLGGLANELILAALTQLENNPHSDNIYLDTSGCMNPRILRHAIDVMGADRILWGTDSPFFDSEVSRFVLQRTGIQGKELRKIQYENVIKLHSTSS
jgi:hypothetical protein